MACSSVMRFSFTYLLNSRMFSPPPQSICRCAPASEMLPTVFASSSSRVVSASSLGKGAMCTVECVPFSRIHCAIASERCRPRLCANSFSVMSTGPVPFAESSRNSSLRVVHGECR